MAHIQMSLMNLPPALLSRPSCLQHTVQGKMGYTPMFFRLGDGYTEVNVNGGCPDPWIKYFTCACRLLGGCAILSTWTRSYSFMYRCFMHHVLAVCVHVIPWEWEQDASVHTQSHIHAHTHMDVNTRLCVYVHTFERAVMLVAICCVLC